MYGRVVTTRSSAQRTQTRTPPQALRPVNYGDPGERVLGGLSREEARRQQTQKYKEDSKKFAEKEKEKAQKKKEEKWKRYSHVDVGRRLNSDGQEFEGEEFVRDQQQLAYELQSAEGLEWERERENARVQREDRRKEEKLKRYSHITSGQQLGSSEQIAGPSSQGSTRARRSQQSEYELQSVGNLQHEQQSSSRCPNVNRLEQQVNYDRAMEAKRKHYQGRKLETETASTNYVSASGSTSSQMNNLNATFSAEEEEPSSISQVERDNENRERMRLARERLQNKYNEELRKSS